MAKYVKKPITVDAIEWRGGDTECLKDFCGNDWARVNDLDIYSMVEWAGSAVEIVVWNKLERFWLPVPVGHFIIRGIDGELYPCAPDVFRRTYEPVETTEFVGFGAVAGGR